MNTLRKLDKSRRCLRQLLHKLKLEIEKSPTDELYRRRKQYRKRLTKLNEKMK